MLPEAYTSMCEEYRAAFVRLLAEPHDDRDPVFLHRAVRTYELDARFHPDSRPHPNQPWPHLLAAVILSHALPAL